MRFLSVSEFAFVHLRADRDPTLARRSEVAKLTGRGAPVESIKWFVRLLLPPQHGTISQ